MYGQGDPRHSVENLVEPFHRFRHLPFGVVELGPNFRIDKNTQMRFVELHHVDSRIPDRQKFLTQYRHNRLTESIASGICLLRMFGDPHPLTDQIRRRQTHFDVPLRVRFEEPRFFGDDSRLLRRHLPGHDLVVSKLLPLHPGEARHDLANDVDITFAAPFAIRNHVDPGVLLHANDKLDRTIHVMLPVRAHRSTGS